MKRYFVFTLILICMLSVGVYASDVVSPATQVIAGQNEMVKSGLMQDGIITFDTNDFDTTLGTNVRSITICSLPDSDSGRLMLGNLYVVENQVVEREDFSLLKFVLSSQNETQDASFTFEPNGNGYEIECLLKSIENVNFSPVASNGETVSVWTQENISSYGALAGYDPDGDALKYEIVNYPDKGLVALTSIETGEYIYTPFADARGTDAFSYRVRDCYGNYSEICTVNIKVDKLRVSLVFNDLDDEKYLNAINAIFQNLNNQVTNGLGLDYTESQWELINKNADQYLDSVNSIYLLQLVILIVISFPSCEECSRQRSQQRSSEPRQRSAER